MQPAEYHTGLAVALWEAIGFGSDERYPPRAPWWLANRGRIPRDLVVF